MNNLNNQISIINENIIYTDLNWMKYTNIKLFGKCKIAEKNIILFGEQHGNTNIKSSIFYILD